MIETIEIVKRIIFTKVFRTHCDEPESRMFMCLHTMDCLPEFKRRFPKIDLNSVHNIISEEIYIKDGKFTTFVFGQTSASRRINSLIKKL